MELTALKQKYHYDGCTPVIQQYLDVKFANLDCLVLFRMGDFYELFFEDAQQASQTLGIALTKRGKCGEEDISMCGVPHHALENYLNKLIEEGFKVAICDQLESPEEAKKRGGYKAVVNRDVVRIITPGTILEESLIAAGSPNYLAALHLNKSRAAVAYVDLSISEISVIDITENDIINEIARLAPKELLVPESLRGSGLALQLNCLKNLRITYQVDSLFALNKCEKIILDFYKISSLSAIGEVSSGQISSLGSILEYISLTQKQNLPQLTLPKIVNYHHFMNIDAATRRNLEITTNLAGQTKGSLLDTINFTVTKAGSRLLCKFISSPLTNIAEIRDRLSLTEFFYTNHNLTANIQKLLKKTGDIERCLTRIAMNRAVARDLLSIKETMLVTTEIKGHFINSVGLNLPPKLAQLLGYLTEDEELYELLEQAIREDAPPTLNDGGYIRHDYHPKIKELYNLIDNGKSYVEDLKKQYQSETGIEALKISHNNMIGLFIEVNSKHSSKINDPKFIHRQTTANTVRYTTTRLQKLESDMVNARTLAVNLEQELYTNICRQVIDKSAFLRSMSYSLSNIDVFCNFGLVANEYNYCCPELTEGLTFEIIGGRHPVIEKGLFEVSKSFIGNDCSLSQEARIWLITGPNMSGKSTFLRQNALITILAQIGSFVPASSATIGVVDKIFSRIGSGDDLLKGQSTFMVEMLETSAILAQSSQRSLVILDEVGRGTSTYDGVAIAWSVLEHIHDKVRCRCLFATHYHELTAMDNFLPALKNYTVSIEEAEGTILFLHHIIPGAADKSYGIHVAELAGLPKAVINRAKEILLKFEKTSSGKNKSLLKTESHSLNLFDVPKEVVKTPIYSKLEQEFKNIFPDQLSPKEALEIIYKLKEL